MRRRGLLRLSYDVIDLETRHAFHIARAAAPARRRDVWVRIIDDHGIDGWGEAAPNAYYGETADTVASALEQLTPVLQSVDGIALDSLPALERALAARATGRSASARAALSAALFDLVGKHSQAPAWQLLNLPNAAPASSFTIGIDALEIMRAKVREAAAYPILKLKVGTPADESILAMLRDERPDAVIRVDANTAWTRDEALRNLPMLEAYRVELLEQPLSPDDLEGMTAVRQAATMPVIADESCQTAADVPRLAGCVDGVNIKLAKAGSLLEAVNIAAAARRHNLQVMLGCMIESTLGIAAAIQVAPLADYIDLDGAALLQNDPFEGPGMGSHGRLRFNLEPGLGVRLRR